MNPTKGLGPDQLPSNLWSAGGAIAAKHLETLGGLIATSGVWPAPLRGSRIVDLWKGKGDRLVCDLSRGLSILSHLTKMFLQPIKEAIEPLYRPNMPASQFGGVSEGGTDFAHHVVLEVINFALTNSLCLFVSFLDLVKAFDRVVRELVFGFPPTLRRSSSDWRTLWPSAFTSMTPYGFVSTSLPKARPSRNLASRRILRP